MAPRPSWISTEMPYTLGQPNHAIQSALTLTMFRPTGDDLFRFLTTQKSELATAILVRLASVKSLDAGTRAEEDNVVPS